MHWGGAPWPGGVESAPLLPLTHRKGRSTQRRQYQAHGCQGWKRGTHFLSHSPLGTSRPQSIRGAGAQTAESSSGNIPPNYPIKSLLNFKCPFASNSSFTNASTVCETSLLIFEGFCLFAPWSVTPGPHRQAPQTPEPTGTTAGVLPACLPACPRPRTLEPAGSTR